MVKAIIWDMDGVIVDSEPHHIAAEIKIFKEYGIDYKEELAHKFFGFPLKEFYKEVGKYYHIDLPFEEVDQKFQKILQYNFENVIPLTQTSEEALKVLSKKYKLALATSSVREFAKKALRRLGVLDLFNVSVCGDEVENGKPDPDIFLEAAKRLGLKPYECIVVEDSPNGIKAAGAAGMKVIAYKAQHNKLINFSLADFTVEDLREISEIIERLNNE